MAVDHIRYDLLAQEALRGVVQRVLDGRRQERPSRRASLVHHVRHARAGRADIAAPARDLPGRHDDRAPAPVLGPYRDRGRLRGRLVVQGRAGTAVRCRFDAIKGFFDPSVQFGLKFEVGEGGRRGTPPAASDDAPAPPRRSASERQAVAPGASKAAKLPAPTEPAVAPRRGKPAARTATAKGRIVRPAARSSGSTVSARNNRRPPCCRREADRRGQAGTHPCGVSGEVVTDPGRRSHGPCYT